MAIVNIPVLPHLCDHPKLEIQVSVTIAGDSYQYSSTSSLSPTHPNIDFRSCVIDIQSHPRIVH